MSHRLLFAMAIFGSHAPLSGDFRISPVERGRPGGPRGTRAHGPHSRKISGSRTDA